MNLLLFSFWKNKFWNKKFVLHPQSCYYIWCIFRSLIFVKIVIGLIKEFCILSRRPSMVSGKMSEYTCVLGFSFHFVLKIWNDACWLSIWNERWLLGWCKIETTSRNYGKCYCEKENILSIIGNKFKWS